MAKQTLRVDLDPVLIERVRRYSDEHGTDVAGTIGELIQGLPPSGGANEDAPAEGGLGEPAGEDEDDWIRSLPPLTRSLLGSGSGGTDEENYKEYLWRKYGP